MTALRVPHRDEFSDTVGFLVEGPSRKLLWLPDIDKWDKWKLSLEDVLAEVDHAFIDATFYSGDELPGRDISKTASGSMTGRYDGCGREPSRSRTIRVKSIALPA